MAAALRLALLAACLAGANAAAAADTDHAGKRTDKHAKKHAASQAHKPAHKPAHASAHAGAHAVARKPSGTTGHAGAHRQGAHKPVHAAVAKAAHPITRAAALAAVPALAQPLASAPVTKPAPKPAAPSPDPDGDGFLNLYVELCVKRIGEIDAFRDKLLRDKVPRLQPESAKAFLSGMAGDAWPVPYKGKMGNFVLVLPEQKNLCMLYARRTDIAAVEQGFAEMVATPPEPMFATRGLEPNAAPPERGATRTVSTSWASPGSERRMQFVLSTTSTPDAQVQAFGSVAIVAGPEPGPGPAKVSASPTRSLSGSPEPAPRPRAQP